MHNGFSTLHYLFIILVYITVKCKTIYFLLKNSIGNVPGVEDEHKGKIIRRAGDLHRQFRTRLRSLAKDRNGK